MTTRRLTVNQQKRLRKRMKLDYFEFCPQTWEDGLRWLLAFVKEDLPRLTKRQRAFFGGVLRWMAPYTPRQRAYQFEKSAGTLPLKALLGLQRQLQDCFTSLLAPSGYSWDLPIVQTTSYVLVRNPAGAGPGFRLASSAQFPARFWLAVAQWIEKAGDRLRACSNCGAPFLAVKRQQYCVKQCSQRVRSRQWYAAHRETVLETRHQRYVDAIHKKINPNAKVKRRRL